MRASVASAFIDLIMHTEGVCTWLYLDTEDFVTTGVGNLVDPIEMALRLPWKHKDGSLATRDEIAIEWTHVKKMVSLEKSGGFAFASVTTLRLSKDDVAALVQKTMHEDWAHLAERFHDLEEWPADAQLGLLSMAWAAGSAFRAPHFDAACKALNFDAAADESGLHTRRDRDDALMFHNAARVLEYDLDPDVLHYPAVVSKMAVVEGDAPDA